MRILVTGSSSGLGLGAARALAAEGHDVVVHRRSASTEMPDADTWLAVLTAFSAAVANRWEGTVTHAVDPGWVPTRMGGAGAPDDLVAGHETQVWLATNDVEPATGAYWHHKLPQQPHRAVSDPAFQADVLAALERLTGVAI